MSWQTAALGEVVTLKRGYDLSSSKRTPGAVPVVSSSGITGWHDTPKVEGPGVVTGRYGTLGQVFYLSRAFWPLNTSLYVRDFKGNHPRFVAYFLRHVLSRTTGDKAAVPGVNRNHLHAMRVRFPMDAGEQEHIASVLAAYDDLIDNNRRRIRLLERAARFLYEEWFVRFRFPGCESTRIIDGVPEGWERKRIGKVCLTTGGGTPSTRRSEYWNGDITWVVPTDVTNNDCLVLLDSARKITEKGLRESSAKSRCGIVMFLVYKDGAQIGRSSYFGDGFPHREACTNQVNEQRCSSSDAIPEVGQNLLYNLIDRLPAKTTEAMHHGI